MGESEQRPGRKNPSGPKPERVKVDDWERAAEKMIHTPPMPKGDKPKRTPKQPEP